MTPEGSFPQCPACGARQATRQAAELVCAYCGTRSTPRLSPGTLCGDRVGSGACSQLAESLCRGCGRPLCDRHNDPKIVYWPAPTHWRCLVPGWSEADGADWERLLASRHPFPVPDFEPFPWVPRLRGAQYELGLLEAEMLEALRPLAAQAGGDAGDELIRFDSVCAACEQSVEERLRESVARFDDRYRELAYDSRLRALREETQQGLRVVEARLRRPLAVRRPQGELTELHADSAPVDWDRWGHELWSRLARLDALRSALSRPS